MVYLALAAHVRDVREGQHVVHQERLVPLLVILNLQLVEKARAPLPPDRLELAEPRDLGFRV